MKSDPFKRSSIGFERMDCQDLVGRIAEAKGISTIAPSYGILHTVHRRDELHKNLLPATADQCGEKIRIRCGVSGLTHSLKVQTFILS